MQSCINKTVILGCFWSFFDKSRKNARDPTQDYVSGLLSRLEKSVKKIENFWALFRSAWKRQRSLPALTKRAFYDIFEPNPKFLTIFGKFWFGIDSGQSRSDLDQIWHQNDPKMTIEPTLHWKNGHLIPFGTRWSLWFYAPLRWGLAVLNGGAVAHSVRYAHSIRLLALLAQCLRSRLSRRSLLDTSAVGALLFGAIPALIAHFTSFSAKSDFIFVKNPINFLKIPKL